jgi:hypothetical protein
MAYVTTVDFPTGDMVDSAIGHRLRLRRRPAHKKKKKSPKNIMSLSGPVRLADFDHDTDSFPSCPRCTSPSKGSQGSPWAFLSLTACNNNTAGLRPPRPRACIRHLVGRRANELVRSGVVGGSAGRTINHVSLAVAIVGAGRRQGASQPGAGPLSSLS